MEEWKASEGFSGAFKAGDSSQRLSQVIRSQGPLPSLKLCAALVGHAGDVRSLAKGKAHLYSGSRDSTVKAWALDEEGHIHGVHRTPEAEIKLPDWVNALTVGTLPQPLTVDGLATTEEEIIVAGCKDGVIYVMQWDVAGVPARLEIKGSLTGHSAPICSLSWSGRGLLLSGAWDDSARAWDMGSGQCTWVLGGHENNVSVLGLGNGLVATGSTGVVVEGQLLGYQIRLWEGTPPKETSSLTDHQGSIRDLCAVRYEGVAFCSCSNDGTVRAWGRGGKCLGSFDVPDNSFVFSVRDLGDGVVAAGDDAGNLTLSDLTCIPSGGGGGGEGEAVISATHPNTVWCLEALPGCLGARESPGGGPRGADVATGSADRNIRVFTASKSRALDGRELAEALEALGEGKGHGQGPGQGSVVHGGGGALGPLPLPLPQASEMGVFVGEEEGSVSAFLDEEGNPMVYRWRGGASGGGGNGGGGEGSWEEVGPLRRAIRKQPLNGLLYDKVVPVEVESASKGFLSLQLGLNNDDDPERVASEFCCLHGLGPEYQPQIVLFIKMMATMDS